MRHQLLPSLLLAAVMLALAACDDDAGDDDDSAGDDDDDSTGDDDDDDSAPVTIETSHTVSDIVPTVVTVSWTVSGAVAQDAWVEFGLDGPETLDRTARDRDDATGGAEGWAYLLGCKPSSTYRYRVVAEVDGEQVVSGETTVTTGDAPSELPQITVDNIDGATRSDWLVTTLLYGPAIPMILDRDGDVVWWYDRPPQDAVSATRARLSRDHEAILVHYSTADPDVAWGVLRIGLDGTEQQSWRIADSHHDFAELPDGTLVLIRADFQDVDGEQVQGDQIAEFHPDGSQSLIWSVWDAVDYAPVDPYAPSWDWSHANFIAYDESDDTYALSLRNFSSVVKIDRSSGELLWRAGGPDAELVPTGGEHPAFNTQHGFDLDGDQLTVFDNRASDDLQARAVRYELDHDTGVAQLSWVYRPEPTIIAPVLGDVVVLPSGHTLVDFSTLGYLVEVGPDGEVLWTLSTSLGGALGYLERHETLD